ncbi:hypothetical protein MRB53_020650 [Persea americana]|uniref:Uncharacterized protein n=1 Tax=Persea americana TaxID=3435 RepID=A0ACC2L2V9_PERAE|nr:hypothetical protein MRB53_020650 [Persea americana]
MQSNPSVSSAPPGYPKLITTGQWPPKVSYATTTPDQLISGEPKLKANVSYLLLHDINSSKHLPDLEQDTDFASSSSTFYDIHDGSSSSEESAHSNATDLDDEEAAAENFGSKPVLRIPSKKKTISFLSDYKMDALKTFQIAHVAKPSFGLSDSDIFQIRKITTASPLIVIPAKIASDGQNKWKKCNLFVDTGANVDLCKKEFLTDWKYYPLGTIVSTMNGTRSLNHFGRNIVIKIGDHTILLDFIQVDDYRYGAGIGSVALDKLGPTL